MSDQQEEFDKYGRRIRGRKSPQNTQPEFDKYGRKITPPEVRNRNIAIGFVVGLFAVIAGVANVNINSVQESNSIQESSVSAPPKAVVRDLHAEKIDGGTTYEHCDYGSQFNSMVRLGGKGYMKILSSRSLLYPDKLSSADLRKLKRKMADICPEVVYFF